MKRILVFGATGNLGRALREEARWRSWEFRGIARNPGDFSDTRKANATHWTEISRVLSDEAPFDLVVFAQGIQRRVGIWDAGPHDFDILAANLDGSLISTILLVRYRRLNQGALLVYCSSIQAAAPRGGRFLYAVAKAGVEALARAVTAETGGLVRGVALRLGQFENTMKGIEFSEAERERLEERTLMGFIPEREIAKFIFDLYDARHIAGCVIDYEGGHLLNIW